MKHLHLIVIVPATQLQTSISSYAATSTATFSNLDKVFWEKSESNPQLTKKDLIEYKKIWYSNNYWVAGFQEHDSPEKLSYHIINLIQTYYTNH